MKAISLSLHELKLLTTLYISNYSFIFTCIIDDNNIGSEGAKAFASALRELKYLTFLDISIF